MLSKWLLSLSSAYLGAIGVALTFAPHELLAFTGTEATAVPTALAQMLGATCCGLGVTNWMSRDNAFGGIYGRPLGVGNSAAFLIAGLGLLKLAARQELSIGWWAIALVTSVFAVAFNWRVFFSSPA